MHITVHRLFDVPNLDYTIQYENIHSTEFFALIEKYPWNK